MTILPYEFPRWVADQARRDRIQRSISLSLDGWPRLRCSHRSLIMASIDEYNFAAHVPFLLEKAEGRSLQVALERIGLVPPSAYVMQALGFGEDAVVQSDNRDSAAAILRALKQDILQICYRERRNLLMQLVDLGIRPDQRVALIEDLSDGVMQAAFELAVRPLMDLEIFGYYSSLTGSDECAARRRHMNMMAWDESFASSHATAHQALV